MAVSGSLSNFYPNNTNIYVLLDSIIDQLSYDNRHYYANELTELSKLNFVLIHLLIDEKTEEFVVVPYSLIMKAYGSSRTEQTCAACVEVVQKFIEDVGNESVVLISSQQISLMYRCLKYLINITDNNNEAIKYLSKRPFDDMVNDFRSYYTRGMILDQNIKEN